MQTTLLGIAIAFILALVTALVGPYFVNWDNHRAYFEAEASRLTGLQVRVTGPIAVSVLPVPSVTLRGIEIGAADEASRLRARSLGIELGLGPLMRGEVRASDMRLAGPEFSVGLNSLGQIDWPAMTLGAETLSIDRLSVEDGRVVLTEAASGSRLVLDRIWFTGDVRSLTGPVRGEGGFVRDGNLFAYRVSVGRLSDDGVRVRLAVETSEQPLSIEAEGMLSVERGAPHFDGSLTVARPAGVVLASGKAVASEPWRIASKVKATAASALLEQLEFQYGPEERAVKLTGAADIKFGERPRLQGALSARQVDLDRLIATPDVPRRLPLAAIQTFAELMNGAWRPSFPIALAVSVDGVTLGGTMLQSVGTDLRSGGSGWQLDKLDFRAPGFTQISLSGRLDAARALGFRGAISVDANDPKTLIAWLAGRAGTAAQIKPWNVRGDITLGADRIAIERLKTEVERGTLEGSLAYEWPKDDRPARLEADLNADELDLDALLTFGDTAFSGLGLEWPREVSLALEAGRARIAGFEARKAAARVKFDAGGIAVERLSVADFGNASIQASGRIQTAPSPGGNITVDLDARDLAGVVALAAKFAPPLADPLRKIAASQKTAKLRATLSLEPGAGSATAKLDLSGRIGDVGVTLAAGATGKPEAFVVTDLGALSATDIRLDGGLVAPDSLALLRLIGLDRLATADRAAARLNVTAAGPLSGAMRVEGRLAAGVIEADGKGTLRLPADRTPLLALDQVSGTFGGSKVQGKLALRFAERISVDGTIEAEALDAPAVVAALIGMKRAGSAATAWSSEPFVPSTSDLGGRIEFTARSATFSPTLRAQRFRGVARFGTSQMVFEDVEGDMAGGRLNGRLAFAGSPEGLSVRGSVALNGADAAALLPGPGRAPITGRVSFRTEGEGAGLSPAAFIGSFTGTGAFLLEAAQLAGLNPRVFDAVIRAVELGIPTDTNRIRDFVTTSLENGNLPVGRVEGTITIAGGQMRIGSVVAQASGADLAVSASLNLDDATLDSTLTLTGMPVAGVTVRPLVFVSLKGPLTAPRRSVDANLLASWLALRAVEQQTKRLDAMEQSRRDAAVPPAVETPVAPAPAAPPASSVDSSIGAATPQPPPLPPAVTIPLVPRSATPRAAPRAEGIPAPIDARPRAQSNPPPQAQPARPAPGRPLNLLGAQN